MNKRSVASVVPMKLMVVSVPELPVTDQAFLVVAISSQADALNTQKLLVVVSYSSYPLAGLIIASLDVEDVRGISIPLSLLFTSSMAEGSGGVPLVLMDILCEKLFSMQNSKKQSNTPVGLS
ncbi:MAG: hypothetical protein IPP93_18650 [Chitinophagaceae bacterium]|nr:hypothetical protein [Chitinophagaceae bacterium]